MRLRDSDIEMHGERNLGRGNERGREELEADREENETRGLKESHLCLVVFESLYSQ